METKCFVCEQAIDMQTDLAVVFECHVYCDKCVKRMEEQAQTPIPYLAKEEPLTPGDESRSS